MNAGASVAWPHRSISIVGVSQRSSNSSPRRTTKAFPTDCSQRDLLKLKIWQPAFQKTDSPRDSRRRLDQ
jgi:hypothetical protein